MSHLRMQLPGAARMMTRRASFEARMRSHVNRATLLRTNGTTSVGWWGKWEYVHVAMCGLDLCDSPW